MSETAKRINFTNIQHEPRKKLGLSMNEYAVADLIYNLSNNPDSIIPGWCFASKETLGEYLDLSKQSVHTIILKLVEKGLVNKDPDTKYLKTTKIWYSNIILTDSKDSLPPVKKVDGDSKESLLGGSKESLHYNNNIYNDNNNIITKVISEQVHETETSGQKTEFGNPDINEIISYMLLRFDLPRLDLSSKTNRQYANILLKQSKKGVNGVLWLIDQAVADPWFKHHICSVRDLWANQVKIVSNVRGQQRKVAVYVES